MNDTIDAVDEIKTLLLSAKGKSEEEQGKIREQITVYQNYMKGAAEGASYAGSNFLSNDATASTELNILSGYNRAADGTTSITVDFSDVRLVDTGGGAAILDEVLDAAFFTGAGTTVTDAEIDAFVTQTETALSAMTDGASKLGAAKNQINLTSNFIKNLSDAVDRGIGQLVDADMNEESTRLQALQVQQQLGIQALSIANQNAQSILSLFR